MRTESFPHADRYYDNALALHPTIRFVDAVRYHRSAGVAVPLLPDDYLVNCRVSGIDGDRGLFVTQAGGCTYNAYGAVRPTRLSGVACLVGPLSLQ